MKFQGVPTSFYHEMTHHAAEKRNANCQGGSMNLSKNCFDAILMQYAMQRTNSAHAAPSAACHSGGTGDGSPWAAPSRMDSSCHGTTKLTAGRGERHGLALVLLLTTSGGVNS